MTAFAMLRRLRLRRLLAAQLANGAEVWDAYVHQRPVPVLRFKDGRTLEHAGRDAPVFLFFEIFANRCYARHLPAHVSGPVVDIGANIGAFTLECAARYPAAHFHAYEPDPASRESLQRNMSANGLGARVTIWPEAVAAIPGTQAFRKGGGSLEAGRFAATGGLFDAACVTLREVVARAGGHASIIKIDAEGAEADIVEAWPDATAQADLIIGEYHEALVPGVAERVRASMAPRFAVRFSSGRRCGPLFVATRRPVV